jgi:hypothetical protein
MIVREDPVVSESDFERTVMTGVMEDLRGLTTYIDESNWRYT